MDGMHGDWTNIGGMVATTQVEEESDLRRGPWTVEEDLLLINYITVHGEGRWNSLARCAGLKRTGKSCRLRWLNYLRPDVRRGNITAEEQLLILELHSRWGNRWSKIAQYLPGRTDNEIKNYWRTRVQKHAKQLQCDVNSKQFKDIMRYLWMPRLVERIQAANAAAAATTDAVMTSETMMNNNYDQPAEPLVQMKMTSPENSGMACSSTSDSMVTQLTPPPQPAVAVGGDPNFLGGLPEALPSPCGYFTQELPVPEFEQIGSCGGGDIPDSFWSMDDFWLLQQQHF